ncbi:MAG: CMP-N-acetlyneuraminic acid synthetase [Elusimicrobia bacterium HGW-Elusimicrobia-1]|nr:MAG: CMP-N-acetlyneuraminic acid synthetase [Elusimicrobia bacterium HGW-Elusimicrobia-1]
MYKNQRILGIIPARGGSKGLPRKNIRVMGGKPLLVWTIEQGARSKYLDRIIVSTDDKKIARVAARHGADVPFIRPARLSTSRAKSIDVVLHLLNRLVKRGENYDVLVLLQPTSPLRKTGDIDKALRLMDLKGADSVVSVCETEHHPYWQNTLPPDGNMKGFVRKKYINRNRQEFPKYYRLNGALFAARVGYIRKHKNFFGPRCYAYIMPKERSVDIDTALDFGFAEYLMKRKKL